MVIDLYSITAEFLFNLLAYAGLLIFTLGILWKKRQAELFLAGGIMLWMFAIYGGDPIFMVAQTILAVASFTRLRKTTDARAAISFLTALTLVGMYAHGIIDSPLRWLGTFAALGLILGVTSAQTLLGNSLFLAGGILMARYAYEVGSWSSPFFGLNIIFSIAVLIEIIVPLLNKKSV